MRRAASEVTAWPIARHCGPLLTWSFLTRPAVRYGPELARIVAMFSSALIALVLAVLPVQTATLTFTRPAAWTD